MSSTTLEIIQGLAQAAANSYDGAHDERYSHDGVARTAGLRREEGCPIMDKRVMDGFSVSFYGNKMCIKYQSDIFLREVYANDFDSEMERRLNEVKKFLQKEYRAITGKSVSLTAEGEAKVLVQSDFFCLSSQSLTLELGVDVLHPSLPVTDSLRYL